MCHGPYSRGGRRSYGPAPSRLLTLAAVGGVADRLRHDNRVMNRAVSVDTDVTEYVVKHLLLCQQLPAVSFHFTLSSFSSLLFNLFEISADSVLMVTQTIIRVLTKFNIVRNLTKKNTINSNHSLLQVLKADCTYRIKSTI